MTGKTAATGTSAGLRRRGSGVGTGWTDSVRGLALLGLALAELGLMVALILELSLAILVFPLLLIPPTLLAARRLANVTRRRSGEWGGVPIPVPYRAYAKPVRGGVSRRFGRASGQLVTDLATWRDLLWMTVNPLVGYLLAIASASAVLWGLFGVLMPAYWSPICGGRSDAAIAQRMVITERAVAKHTSSIFTKLGLQPSDDDNRRVLAVLAYLGR